MIQKITYVKGSQSLWTEMEYLTYSNMQESDTSIDTIAILAAISTTIL